LPELPSGHGDGHNPGALSFVDRSLDGPPDR